jgi:hypothetical protein
MSISSRIPKPAAAQDSRFSMRNSGSPDPASVMLTTGAFVGGVAQDDMLTPPC